MLVVLPAWRLGSAGVALGSIAEAANADSAQDATVTAAAVFATWDPATIANVTLSGGNLVVSNTSTAGETGARGANAVGKTSGKYYFEITTTTVVGAGGGNTGIGVGTTGSNYTGMGNNATAGAIVYCNNGGIFANSANTGFVGIGAFANGNVIGIAIDLDNRKAFFRKGAAGVWNGMGTHNPATNTGGATIPAGTIVPFCCFGGSGATTGNTWTANFGASVFVGAVPSGFASGWSG
jgi:hypothetical protein